MAELHLESFPLTPFLPTRLRLKNLVGWVGKLPMDGRVWPSASCRSCYLGKLLGGRLLVPIWLSRTGLTLLCMHVATALVEQLQISVTLVDVLFA